MNDGVGIQENMTATVRILSVSNDMVVIDQPNVTTVTVTDDESMQYACTSCTYIFSVHMSLWLYMQT